MKWRELRDNGHWPTLVTTFLYFDVSFMVWTMLGAMASFIAPDIGLTPQEKFLMVAMPTLAGAVLRIVLGLLVDRIGTKTTGIAVQLIVMAGLAVAWQNGLNSLNQALALGLILGLAGASFAVALPQAGRWYPPRLQGAVLGLAGAGNIGVVIDHLLAPRLAAHFGWASVFGWALIPASLAFVLYLLFSREAPNSSKPRRLADYGRLLCEPDVHWFCFFYTISFGGFVGLATAFSIYFSDEFGLSLVQAGEMAAGCTLVGALSRPIGGAMADRLGGIRSLHMFFFTAAAALALAAQLHNLWLCAGAFLIASAAFGMCNGSVFQLLPQRFGRDLGAMTGLVGCGGGVGGFLLSMSLGYSKGLTGGYTSGLMTFAVLSLVALAGLMLVKKRWRTTWGATAQARI